MNLTTYKATGVGISAVKNVLGVRMRLSGVENVADRPTMFVVNHFTRLETFLIPYAIYAACRRPVHCLGTHTLFNGILGNYLRAVGVVSVRDPRRNRTVIRELMTGTYDWVIYPEGGLIKNKKTVDGGRLYLTHPDHHGPPHTGAAVLALKAEISRRRYLKACEQADFERKKYYQDQYDLAGPDRVCQDGVVITPISITFYPMRPGNRMLKRLAKLLSGQLDQRTLEELEIEGGLLLEKSEINIHFGAPIEVSDYLSRASTFTRRLVGAISEAYSTEVFLRRQAMKLTRRAMISLYNGIEINVDHLFCQGLYALQADRIGVDDFHRALFLAAAELAQSEEVRVHPSLANGTARLATGQAFEPVEDIARLVCRQGILRRDNGWYLIDQRALHQHHDFHAIRLKNMPRVIANELQPIAPAMRVIERTINLPSEELKRRAAAALHRAVEQQFLDEHDRPPSPDAERSSDLGQPFFLQAADSTLGVILIHGYLGCPGQMRPMAEYLHDHGLTVYGVRLAGHGTSPDRLANVTWNDWLESVAQGYAMLRHRCEKIVVGGFSLGGILAIHLAAEQPEHLAGLFTINAPFQLRDRRLPFLPLVLGWKSLLNHFGFGQEHFQRSNHDTECPDLNYELDDLRSIHELRRAVRASRRKLRRVHAPAFIVQADRDPVVAPSGAERALDRLCSPLKLFAPISSDRHVIVRGEGSEAIFRSVHRFIQRVSS